MASNHLKGKGWEVLRDLPSHVANYAGLLFDGQEVLSSDVYNVLHSSVVPARHVQPSSVLVVTHLQKKKET